MANSTIKSTMNLLWGIAPAWQKVGKNQYSEVECIFSARGTGNNFSMGEFQGDDFITSTFWRNFVRRMWQLDDFKFEGLAAASYLP